MNSPRICLIFSSELLSTQRFAKDGSLECFVGSVVLAIVLSQSMHIHDSYFIQSRNNSKINGGDSVFRINIFDAMISFGIPLALYLPFYRNGDHNMNIPQNKAMIVTFLALPIAATMYFVLARISMYAVGKKRCSGSDNRSSGQFWNRFVATFLILTCLSYIVVNGTIAFRFV